MPSPVRQFDGLQDAPLASRSRDAGSQAAEHYSIAIGYLRAFVTLLVVAHHAVLAYHQFAPPAAPVSLTAEPRWWPIFPVIDPQRWPGFTIFTAFNDTFFMALMFFLSGLFVWPSLTRKGTVKFLRDRSLRLGAPFLLATGILAPLAYYPAYLTTTRAPVFAEFWRQWLSLGRWPAGPAWFLWVLLLFDFLAAAAFQAKAALPVRFAGMARQLSNHPARCFAMLAGASTLAYVPLAAAAGPLHWTAVGPFSFQTSRIVYYAVYFAAGLLIGGSSPAQGLMAAEGRLARRWVRWMAAALVSFVAGGAVIAAAMTQPDGAGAWIIPGGIAFAVSCAAISFAMIALFLRFAHTRLRAFESIRRNAYGIYVLHYGAVTWMQYALLGASLPGVVKGVIVFAGSALVSGMAAAWLPRLWPLHNLGRNAVHK